MRSDQLYILPDQLLLLGRLGLVCICVRLCVCVGGGAGDREAGTTGVQEWVGGIAGCCYLTLTFLSAHSTLPL